MISLREAQEAVEMERLKHINLDKCSLCGINEHKRPLLTHTQYKHILLFEG